MWFGGRTLAWCVQGPGLQSLVLQQTNLEKLLGSLYQVMGRRNPARTWCLPVGGLGEKL